MEKQCVCVCISISQITWNQWIWYIDFEGSVQKKIQSPPGLCSYSLTHTKSFKLKPHLPATARRIFLNAIFIMTFLSSSSSQSNINLKRLIWRFTFSLLKSSLRVSVQDNYSLFLNSTILMCHLSPEILKKSTATCNLYPRDYNLVGLGWNLWICIF